METIECIKKRRSTRKFIDKEVFDEIIEKLIDAARHAPFGGPPIKDCQLWEFIIVRDKEIKEKLALNFEDREFMKQAPVIIVVCADRNKDPKYKNWDISAALAVENILLSAHDLGLGACYVDTFNHHDGHKEDRQKLIDVLELPNHIELISTIPLGYPDDSEEKEKKELRDIDKLIHLNKY